MKHTTVKTKSGESVVFHKSQTGWPQLFHGGPWFFEPVNWNINEVYSCGFATQRAALEAAEEEEADREQPSYCGECGVTHGPPLCEEA